MYEWAITLAIKLSVQKLSLPIFYVFCDFLSLPNREVQELKEMIYECGQCVDVKPWTIEPEYAPSKIGMNPFTTCKCSINLEEHGYRYS